MNNNNQQKLSDAMRAAGISSDFVPDATGRMNRFYVEGDRPGTKNGWQIGFNNSISTVVACFGTWKQPEISHTWCSDSGRELSQAEKSSIRKKSEEAKARLKFELVEKRELASHIARAILSQSLPASPDHPYLLNKQIKANGIYQHKGALVVPITVGDSLVSLQFIQKSGEKRFLKNGEIKGGHFLIGQPKDRILICEGFATGASLHEATGHAVAVALNAGNLLTVAKAFREKFPKIEIVLCADNDVREGGGENTGVVFAKKAASEVNAAVAIPQMEDGRKCDFNDLFQSVGVEAVQSVIKLASGNNQVLTLPVTFTYESTSPDYVVTKDGVFFIKKSEEFENNELSSKKKKENDRLWICTPLHVAAVTRSDKQQDFGRLLKWTDSDKVEHQWAMPMKLLDGDGAQYRRELLRLGLVIAAGHAERSHLSRYIITSEPPLNARCINSTGWFDGMFVLPDQTIGKGDEEVIFQASEVARHNFDEKGSLESWQKNVAALCVGNSRLIFSLCCAFAAPLLYLVQDESGGFHLRGQSSNGKSTALIVGASVWGGQDYLQSWRATGNGMEGVAVLHNDLPLYLDEIGQVDPREAGDIAYLLANSQGKARAGTDGMARKSSKWRLIFLSSGEVSLADHMMQAGKLARAGQEIRMADVPADAGMRLGVFEALHHYRDGAELSAAFISAVRKNHGTAGPAYINGLVENLKDLPGSIRLMKNEFVNEVVPHDERGNGQVIRVAQRFALVAVAGELATNLGITGWKPHAAEEAVKACFNAWIESRESGELETASILSQIKRFFETHGESRFAEMFSESDQSQRITTNRAGFVRRSELGMEYLVLPEVYKAELCAGLNAKTVTKILKDKGWLTLGTDGMPQVRETLPGLGRTRCYIFNSRMWEV